MKSRDDSRLSRLGSPRHDAVLDEYQSVGLAIIVPEVLAVTKRRQQMHKRLIGRFIVADPAICPGQPTFRGARILVADVIEQVAGGMACETIVEEWRGSTAWLANRTAAKIASARCVSLRADSFV